MSRIRMIRGVWSARTDRYRTVRRSKVSTAQLRRSLTAWFDWTYRTISRCRAALRLFLTARPGEYACPKKSEGRSEEHTSELQSLMRISYAASCLKKKTRARSDAYVPTHNSILQIYTNYLLHPCIGSTTL